MSKRTFFSVAYSYVQKILICSLLNIFHTEVAEKVYVGPSSNSNAVTLNMILDDKRPG